MGCTNLRNIVNLHFFYRICRFAKISRMAAILREKMARDCGRMMVISGEDWCCCITQVWMDNHGQPAGVAAVVLIILQPNLQIPCGEGTKTESK
jgi:glycogen synthase